MFFETKDLIAKRLTANDAARFHQICMQPYILRWMDDWDMTPDQVQNLIAHFIDGYDINDPEKRPFIMGIWHKRDDRLIGICGFGPKDELDGKAEIAYFIDEQYANRGYMSQIMQPAIRYFFAHFDKPYLCAMVDDENVISKRMLLKQAFQAQDADKSMKPHYRLYREQACAIRLETDRLILRDHTWNDLDSHYQILTDDSVMRYHRDIEAHSFDDAKENLSSAIADISEPLRERYFLRIDDKITGEHIGEIGYTVEQRTPLGKIVGLGYFIFEKYWGKGYTTEAAQEMIRFAFEEDDVVRVSSGCLLENAGSYRVMEKCGMIREAHRVKCAWHEGELKDRVEYRLLKEEW